MSANVETMFSVREKPWHYEFTKEVTRLIQSAPTSEAALRFAGLDWEVSSAPIFDESHNQIPGYCANIRNSDNSVLGIVSNKYSIVQNKDAFEFTDALIGEGLQYETAGSLRGGRQIWLLGKLPSEYILGDEIEPYICFTNTHDGSGAVRACMTPIRVVCNNTLNLALSKAKRSWSTPHRGEISTRLAEAKETLGLAKEYITALDEDADRLANSKMDSDAVVSAFDQMLPLPIDASDRQKAAVAEIKDQIVCCMLSPDLVQFVNTKWGFINAVSDYVGHAQPRRNTKNFEANRWGNILAGQTLLDKAYAAVR